MLIRRHLQPDMHCDTLLSVPLDAPRRALLRMLKQGHNLSLVGPAGVGKTRLLREIGQVPERQLEGLPVLPYLDCQDLQEATEQQLFTAMAEAVCRSRPDLASGDNPSGSRLDHHAYARLVSILDTCAQRGLRVCYLLDHFDVLAQSPHLDTSVFSALRSLCSRPEVSLVCATRVPLTELPQITPEWGSPLCNVFMVLRLREQRPQSRPAVRRPVAGGGIAVPA